VEQAARADTKKSETNPPEETDMTTQTIPMTDRIRAAYQYLSDHEPGRWVGLADLRDLIGAPKADMDAGMLELVRTDDTVNIVPESNQKTLRQRDRDAAVRIGNQDKHLISFDR
jgi:hypothetical protein